METGFRVNRPWIELDFHFRLGSRRPMGAFLRAFWRWIRTTAGVRLGFAPPPPPRISHARVDSLDEGFAAYRQLRGVEPVQREVQAPAPRPQQVAPSHIEREDTDRFYATRRAAPRSRAPRLRDPRPQNAPRHRRPSGTGDCFFGVTSTRRAEIQATTRHYRKELVSDDPE